MNLTHAVVYDIETWPNCFIFGCTLLHGNGVCHTWEISDRRDDRDYLLSTFDQWHHHQTPMIGFNTLSFDYPIIHLLMCNPHVPLGELYGKAQQIIRGGDRFGHMVWDRDRFAPQIDLFKIHHFDNKAKGTSLKALQINMRSPFVMSSPLEFDVPLTGEQIDTQLIPYNHNDLRSTMRFAHYSLPAIDFRRGIIDQFGLEVLNYNDTKIGEKMLEKRLGRDICYDSQGQRRQTPRYQIALSEIIFPYVRFENPEFARVLEFMKAQVIGSHEWSGELQTKGVLTNLTAQVGGLTFYFGTGGVHASVERQRYVADDHWMIRDIDVEGLYPSIAIVNRLAPEHLGERFIAEYARIPVERKQHAKGTYQNAALKLAANGAWGKSNSQFSCFYDPKYAMTIPINGQLMICMLAEWLLSVPTLQLIQCNTDGITYKIHRTMEHYAQQVCDAWQKFTCLKLESAEYARMWIRDVNNYIAEDIKDKLKQKGAYWHPDPDNYADSITTASPPCWYKDLGNIASIRAAVANMVHGTDIAMSVAANTDDYDFMLRAKADRGSKLMLGERQIQSPTRYYIAKHGLPMCKLSPPPDGYKLGWPKRGQGVSEYEYFQVMQANNFQWDERVCTKNKGTYDERRTGIESGWLVADCNDARHFNRDNLNFDYYIGEARKLIV